jgi:hypothetical protein
MDRDSRKHARDVAWKAVVDAKRVLGPGWDHISDDLRWGLVSANLLSVIVGQHWIDDPKATFEQKAAVADYALTLWAEGTSLREAGWKR